MPPKFWAEKTRTVLRRWLAAEEDVAAPPPDKGDGDKWYDGSEIESLSMEQILSEGIAEGRDKVFIIALNDFSAAVGDKWDRLKTKVDLISDNAARRHLERGSLYQNIGEGVYLVTVQVSGGADCQAKVFAMAEDLGRRLVGDRFVSLASSGVAVAEADASLLLDAHGPPPSRRSRSGGWCRWKSKCEIAWRRDWWPMRPAWATKSISAHPAPGTTRPTAIRPGPRRRGAAAI